MSENENDREQCDIPEDFKYPNQFGKFANYKKGITQDEFLEKEERKTIAYIREKIRAYEENGAKLTDKIGFIFGFSRFQSGELLNEFFMEGAIHTREILFTILTLLYKNILEKIDAEEAVFGINAQEDETK